VNTIDKEQRKEWNRKHKHLRETLKKPEDYSEAIALFLSQHRWLHSLKIDQGEWDYSSLQDDLLCGLEEEIFRKHPVPNPDTKNSIAWHLWHISRVEDMTMNILVADEEQVYTVGDWPSKMNISVFHSGNEMKDNDISELSATIDFDELVDYREKVGLQTRRIISKLSPEDFNKGIPTNRINRLFQEKALLPEAAAIAEYWSSKTIGGLMLMPGTRHNFLHLNKAIRIKERLERKVRSR
jgi:DinB superfamily